MTAHTIGTREEWLTARLELLEREKELDRRNAELVEQRRALPWVRVDKEYRFDTDGGVKTLAELFEGRSRLIIYHAMFGPSWSAPCPGCASLVDALDGSLTHVHADDATLLAMSHAPLEKLQAHKRRAGWTIPYVSSYESGFNHDFGVSFTEEQARDGAEYNYERVDFAEVVEGFAADDAMADIAASIGTDVAGYVTTEGPGLFVFALDDGIVYHTYSSYAPEVNPLAFHSQILDRAPGNPSDAPESSDDDHATTAAR